MILFLLVVGVVAVAMLGLFLGLVFAGRRDKPKSCHGLAEGETSHEDHGCDHCTCGAAERGEQGR